MDSHRAEGPYSIEALLIASYTYMNVEQSQTAKV